MENDFRFDELEHRYFLGSVELTGTTTAMKLAGLIDTTWFTDEARERGQAVHAALQYLAEGSLDPESVHEKIRPYICGFNKFMAENTFETLIFEVPTYHPIYLYGARPDRIGILNGEVGVLDFKTGVAQAWAEIQTAAYAAIAELMPEVKKAMHERGQIVLKKWGLELRDDATYRLKTYADRNAFKVFLSALTVANWIRGKR